METTNPAIRWVGMAKVTIEVMLPILIVLTSLRLLLTDAFIQVEYRTPNFPADPYGFSFDDRTLWSSRTLEWLIGRGDVDDLAQIRFDDGTAIYNSRELGHMDDVKTLTSTFLTVWRIGMVLTIALGIALWRSGRMEVLGEALRVGAKLTVLILIGVGLLLAVSFSFVFVGFHRLFFEGNTWIFPYSDTLIRLFPERFWRDVFLWLLGLSVGLAVLINLLGKRFLKN